MAKRLVLVGLVGAFLLGASACNHNLPEGVGGAYYDYLGNYCGTTPASGCTTKEDGSKASIFEDVYFGLSGFSFTRGYCENWDGPCSQTWWSPNGVWYGMDGFALNARVDRGRDMMGDMAEDELAGMERTATCLADLSGLAQEQAIEIVRDLNAFETATRGRGRTEADYEALSKRVLGKPYRDVVAAIASQQLGDEKALRALERDVAVRWGTDPESVRETLQALY